MNDKTILVWFKNDLRLHDNEILVYAMGKAAKILPVYCFDARLTQQTRYGTLKTGYHRVQFLIDSVNQLRNSLRAAGADLVVRTGDPVQLIPQLAIEYGVCEVVHHAEVTDEEIQVAEKVEAELWKSKINLKDINGHTLYHKEDLPFPMKDLPDIFTNFRKKIERDCRVRPCLPTPKAVQTPVIANWGEIPSPEDFGLTKLGEDPRTVLAFKGGEENGLLRLEQYLWINKSISEYKNTRNGLLGADYSSKFSAWLATGCLSPRKIYEEIKRYELAYGENESTYWLVFELLWRDYFFFVFKKYGNRLFRRHGFKQSGPPKSAHQHDHFERWKSGKTGVPFIDANMRELNTTGFMSNRGRQNVASFLIKDLKVTWTWGAAYFEEKLIDYCATSNWGNWAYIAGVGNDPRENRYFNVIKQAADYDPHGDYVRTWVPELKNLPGQQIHAPFFLSDTELLKYGIRLEADYPRIIISPKWQPFAKTTATLFD
jgi:deoxyribodipyrimidine photo-lyase